jgi:hypothetical protein
MRRSALVENLWRDGLRRENRGVLVGMHTRYALYKAIDYPSAHQSQVVFGRFGIAPTESDTSNLVTLLITPSFMNIGISRLSFSVLKSLLGRGSCLQILHSVLYWCQNVPKDQSLETRSQNYSL